MFYARELFVFLSKVFFGSLSFTVYMALSLENFSEIQCC